MDSHSASDAGSSPPIGDNAHLTVSEFKEVLGDEIARLEGTFGGSVTLSALGPPKTGADNTTTVLLSAEGRGPSAVLICSRSVAPEMVSRAVERAESFRRAVGARLGQAVIRPILSGRVLDRTYAVYPWCADPCTPRASWLWRRRPMRRVLFRWLRDVAATGRATEKSRRAYASALQHMHSLPFVTGNMRHDLERALVRLEGGIWSPRHVPDHNDFWMGNVLLQQGIESNSTPFVLIDWAGANASGFGVYDLLRLARSIRGVSSRALATELRSHAAAMECADEDLEGHLLASLGWLHRNLEEFPEENYRRVMTACWHMLKDCRANR